MFPAFRRPHASPAFFNAVLMVPDGASPKSAVTGNAEQIAQAADDCTADIRILLDAPAT